MTKQNQSGRHDKRQAQKLRLELQQAKQLIKKLHNDQEVVPAWTPLLLFFALLVLWIACYAEDVCQYWFSPLTPPGH